MDTNDKASAIAEVLSPETKRARRKRAWWLWFVLIVGVILTPYFISRYQASANRIKLVFDDQVLGEKEASEDSNVRSLTVATFNIAHGRGTKAGNWSEGASPKYERIKAIADTLREIDADVVVMNEVDFDSTWSGHQNQAAAIAEAAGYAYRVDQRNLDFRFIYGSFRFGNVILSRYPIADAQVLDFPPEKIWEDWLVGCKRGVVASIRLNQFQRIRVAAVHLEHRSEFSRVAGAKTILNLLDTTGKNPLIAAGDFNSTPTGYPKSRKHHSGDNAMGVLLDGDAFWYEPTAMPRKDQFTFSTMKPTSVIDWILVSKAPSQDRSPFNSYRVVDTPLSDHRIVVAEVQLETNR